MDTRPTYQDCLTRQVRDVRATEHALWLVPQNALTDDAERAVLPALLVDGIVSPTSVPKAEVAGVRHRTFVTTRPALL